MIRTRSTTGPDGNPYRVITIDRPGAANALRPQDLDRLEAAVAEADESVVHLRGTDGMFCAGADLGDVAALTDPAAFAAHGQHVANTIESADKVVVAGIEGAARGGGVELALACDIRVATPDATLAESGIDIGLFGAWGGTHRLPRLLREGDALEFALTGRTVGAEEAHQLGLVSRVDPEPERVTQELARKPTDALRVVRRRFRDSSLDRTGAEEAERTAFAELHAAHAEDL